MTYFTNDVSLDPAIEDLPQEANPRTPLLSLEPAGSTAVIPTFSNVVPVSGNNPASSSCSASATPSNTLVGQKRKVEELTGGELKDAPGLPQLKQQRLHNDDTSVQVRRICSAFTKSGHLIQHCH